MFSRKSTTLMAHIERYLIAEKVNGREILVFNHASDDRYGTNKLATHSGSQIEGAIGVHDTQELMEYICQATDSGFDLKPEFRELNAIFIDEAQFFDELLPDAVDYLDKELGIDVFLAGLDTDFRGQGFGPMGELMTRADQVEKHTAICTQRINGRRCGLPATKTQRLVNDEPAKFEDPIIMVGASEAYTARCKEHHQVPGKPEIKLEK
jgi:thymidine kinase